MFAELMHRVILYNPKADVAFLSKAYHFAEAAHQEQRRFSGEPFILHPVAVARILADLELDLETLVAGLLHDVVEDTGVPLPRIEEEFGAEVALLVDGVTKLSRLGYKSKEERQAENLRKMFLAMAKDIRVILIKLADRLHNLRTLKYQPEDKQKEIADETLEIFAPLAHRLGIYHLKSELEDLAFRYTNPARYFELSQRIASTRRRREEYIREAIDVLREKLESIGIKTDIKGRPKNLYSIYEKMKKQNKDLNEIYDVLAVRIIVDSVRDCYASLGTVHTLWKPIPGRFKDYIAMPKSNMYQSLHTTVVGPHGEPLEIQIRTQEMHRTAEYGIAAHWRYKEGGRSDKNFDEKLAWLRQLLEWQHDLRDAREFMESLKIDLFADTVFVFTPKGDVIELPAGSVPIDFAYRVHTQVGHRCVGAKVNGKIVPLDYKLKNGDIVEILTARQAAGPSRDWLNVVKTSQAKSRIRQWFKREQREENILKGRDSLEREFKKQGLELELLKNDRLLEIGRRFNLVGVDDVYAAIADGTISPLTIVNRVKEDLKKEELKLARALTVEEQPVKSEPPPTSQPVQPVQGIQIKGTGNLLTRLAHCCNPVPGDPITGYITRGRGVSIHRSDCRNVALWQKTDRGRLVEASWDKEFQHPFQVKLEITAMDRAGLLSDVMAVIAEMKMSASWVTARGRKDRQASIEMILEMKSKEELDYLIGKINRVKDVYEVRRTS
ncbi:MAG: bifunctional (p)ppGpp synthetase/guanosine-3',5'-bis(diphosphate) 3'-pyrophosphohydrolase [Armatimonadetes bacterium]|nr:bifunctional (p)ppGpp synthetase/guanosine-3',5'-bis(diphosphate) 3'-pyrophosphohydrolase [Armatimonadota bacterium]